MRWTHTPPAPRTALQELTRLNSAVLVYTGFYSNALAVVVHWLSCCVQLFATPRTAARQASLSFTNSQSSLRLRSMESVMPPSHLPFCRPCLLLPSVLPSVRVHVLLFLRTDLHEQEFRDTLLWASSALVLRAALLVPLSRGFPSRVAPARLGQAHEPVLRPGRPTGSHRAAAPSCPLWAAGAATLQARVPAITATLHKDQTRSGGQSGPGDAGPSQEAPVSSDPLTHVVLFHTRSTTCVCKPHGLCVCLSKVFSPGAHAAHTCPDSLETTHTCPRPQPQHTSPETGSAHTVRIPFYTWRFPAW